MKLLNFSVLALSILSILTSCHWASEKTHTTINKAGEFVGKTSSEFGDGIYKGVKETFDNQIIISDELKAKGIDIGEVSITSSDSSEDNVLKTYIIFNDNIDTKVMIKLFNDKGKEYGRLKQEIKGEKGDARHIKFIFDKEVSIGSKGKVSFEHID